MTTPSTTTALRGDQQPPNDDDIIHAHEDDPEFYPLGGIDRTRYHVIKTPPYQTFDKGPFCIEQITKEKQYSLIVMSPRCPVNPVSLEMKNKIIHMT